MGYPNNTALFDKHSIIIFAENTAIYGGALSWLVAHISFQGNSTIIFRKNKATTGEGGAVHCNNCCSLIFDGDSNISEVGGGTVGTMQFLF